MAASKSKDLTTSLPWVPQWFLVLPLPKAPEVHTDKSLSCRYHVALTPFLLSCSGPTWAHLLPVGFLGGTVLFR